jgi:hypothetical protein
MFTVVVLGMNDVHDDEGWMIKLVGSQARGNAGSWSRAISHQPAIPVIDVRPPMPGCGASE